MRFALIIFWGLTCLFWAANAETPPTFQLSWPTPNPSYAQGLGYSAFLQKTGPDKEFSSGAFGCVRNNGHKFHEGVDLFPIRRDNHGRAQDLVFAALSGKVSYLNQNAGYSAYGKYLVLEHSSLKPAIYTLYAHLAEILPELKIGTEVRVAQALGKMGNSSSFAIPLSRSHLHFEIGLRLSDRFQNWFDSKSFKTPNRHGNFSGFNLVGIDPLHFFSEYRNKSFKDPLGYLQSLPTVVKIRIRAKGPVFFARRYPSLCPNFKSSALSWDCSFGPFGIPLRIEPARNPKSSDGQIEVLSYDLKESEKPCRKLIEKKNGAYRPTDQLQSYLELIFGI